MWFLKEQNIYQKSYRKFGKFSKWFLLKSQTSKMPKIRIAWTSQVFKCFDWKKSRVKLSKTESITHHSPRWYLRKPSVFRTFPKSTCFFLRIFWGSLGCYKNYTKHTNQPVTHHQMLLSGDGQLMANCNMASSESSWPEPRPRGSWKMEHTPPKFNGSPLQNGGKGRR